MQTDDRTPFGQAMIGARNAIGQGDAFSESDLDLMFMALSDLTLDQVKQALIDHMNSKNGKWRPGTSYVRDMVQQRAGAMWISGNEAWGRLALERPVGTIKRPNDWGDMVTRRDQRAAEPLPCLMNQQMMQALAAAQLQIDAGDMIPARVTFIETYTRLVEIEKTAGRPPRYWVSPGGTHEQREEVQAEGVRLGLLNKTWAPAVPQLGHAPAQPERLAAALALLNPKSLPPPEAE